ncbi:MAG: PAS domain-containing protein [Carboxylicivirga sp.]|jgi:DUF438 domain-containing protein/uncharacterized protein (DUF2249 family)|nr:PAS domain-containing protein [Carboxylicivirga sp.]
MKSNITFIKLDGRNQQEEFHSCVTEALNQLSADEGLHIIKDFEPFPLYELMAKKGFDKRVEQKAKDEFHVWFTPKAELEMKQYLDLDHEKMQKIMDIKLKVFNKELSPKAAKDLVNKTFDKITAEEFAYGEQQMIDYGISDDHMVDDMDDIIEVFKDVMETSEIELPAGHPIHTYRLEADAIECVVQKMEKLIESKFIKNQWLELYDKLSQINVHFSRKQNQLFSALETKGFDRPSKVMWSFDNKVREAIKNAYTLLETDKDNAFLDAQANVFHVVRDILEKEREVLYPTSLQLLSDEEFVQMRISDDEIGYCLIDKPPVFKVKREITKELEKNDVVPNSLLNDLTAVLAKHGVSPSIGSSEEMDVSMGKLSLERINLIFKHLQVDLSYVDENDVVKFYSDTKHRVFPRSAGVIGRKVQNCHPRESVETVEQIIDAFRKGEQNEAEFWLEIGGKFIYIIYNAVRDEAGNFKGVLEMMQDVTHIRSLTGSQKLLTWKNEGQANDQNEETIPQDESVMSSSIIATVIKQYPFIKNFLINLNPKFKQLKNPMVFKTMGNIATIEMIAKRGGYSSEELLGKIRDEIERHKNN